MWNTNLTDDAKRPIRRPSGIVVEGSERHGCCESRDGPGTALRGVPAMMERGNGAKRSNSQRLARRVSAANQVDEVGPDARGKTFCLLLAWPAIRAFAKSEPP
jgi:hypothetical protein